MRHKIIFKQEPLNCVKCWKKLTEYWNYDPYYMILCDKCINIKE